MHTDAWPHIPVLLSEAIDALIGDSSGTYVDGTFGRGGHTRAALARLSRTGRLVAFDKDPLAVQAALVGPARIDDPRFSIEHASFASMRERLAARGISAVNGVLLDLGVSSPQIDEPSRGFSFRVDAPLDMRMDTSRGETAAQFLQRADERQIAEVIRDYGEERFAVPIAKALVARRAGGRPVGRTESGQDPATRTFQALRIFVNAELEDLEQGLIAAMDLLIDKGRLVVISFHSLEDRIVKRFIARESKSEPDRRVPFAPPAPVRLKALARVRPAAAEVQTNPRARSAVMRVAERTRVA
jgi:16S rRNA (cytosine1402-N4)-methyltransferase